MVSAFGIDFGLMPAKTSRPSGIKAISAEAQAAIHDS